MLGWEFLRFADLGVDNLYDALALRARVFILEQGPYVDADGADQQSWHLLGRSQQGVLQAYLRVVDAGVKFAEPSIGRVITAPEIRGTGQGHVLIAEGLRRAAQVWPGRAVRISAQAHLDRYYVKHGFVAQGEVYIEDTIPHLQMLWRPHDSHP